MQLAVQLVNSGKCREAVTMLDLLLHHHPGSVGGYAARGTAHALLGQLKGEGWAAGMPDAAWAAPCLPPGPGTPSVACLLGLAA